MPGRTIPDESAYTGTRFDDPVLARRREVLRETVAYLHDRGRARLHALAADNVARWAREAATHSVPTDPRATGPRIEVVPDDWGEATARATRRSGACFAVLNMANAHVPGGAYVEGTVAQEENMFRRTDCHEAVDDAELDPLTQRYRPEMTARLNAADGLVYLDTRTPRVCVRGPEDRAQADLGYAWLADDEVFPFFELRAAAEDLRGGKPFDEDEMARRIHAQLDTLRYGGVRHVVLSAFGCGAFHNPADRVAALYRDALARTPGNLEEVVFAIFAPGYGPDNYTPFADAFAPGR
ncbi:poly(ADP-ribose) glycohydrolase domain-containing protein [Paraliomyxa miuraensis]|uniref:poly(ADP-ribose) glycohydrolase domain-containing protein n=1 Tax=Paraliomyxa miuraensis TaxID=376150 RepID=UPI002252B14B|nr:poly(ADP-ribose) glycohydrolase domain-containing protein [Paraliomyxa miuraensis]MCX4247163.1 DUF2263 domain-containing protein [Paraliomyxa miuraensis]